MSKEKGVSMKILSPDELKQLTQKKQSTSQKEVLNFMGIEKNGCIQVKRPLKYWRSAVKPYPGGLKTGNFHAYKECGASVYLLTALSNGLQTILSIIRIAQDQQCVIRKENVNV